MCAWFGSLVLPRRIAARGPEVQGIAKGDFVIAPFIYCDGTCAHCRAGVTSQCVHGGGFGNHGIDGGQGEAVRVPLAGTTLDHAAVSAGAMDERSAIKSLIRIRTMEAR